MANYVTIQNIGYFKKTFEDMTKLTFEVFDTRRKKFTKLGVESKSEKFNQNRMGCLSNLF